MFFISYSPPLEIAADFGRAECANLLLENGAKSNQIQSQFYTPGSFQVFSNPLTFLWSIKEKINQQDIGYEKTLDLISNKRGRLG